MSTRERLARMLGPDLLDLLGAFISEEVESKLAERETARRWLTTSEAATYLGTSPGAIRKRVGRGSIPYTRSGGPRGRLLIDRRALDAQLDNGRLR